MAAALDIVLEQYSSYTLDLTLQNADTTPVDLTDHTFEFKIAKRIDKTKVFEIDGANGSITITDAVNGKVSILINEVTLAPTSTDSNMTIDPVDYYYTFKIIDAASKKTRVLDGLVAIAIGIV